MKKQFSLPAPLPSSVFHEAFELMENTSICQNIVQPKQSYKHFQTNTTANPSVISL